MRTSKRHFENWAEWVKKLPPGGAGLAIGADIGFIEFRPMENNLIAIGDTIVWASRMCSAADVNEIVCNNMLYHVLKNRKRGKFEPINGETKSGEPFQAYRMLWEHEVSK